MKTKKMLSLVMILTLVLSVIAPVGLPVYADTTSMSSTDHTFDINEGNTTLTSGTGHYTGMIAITHGATSVTAHVYANDTITLTGTTTLNRIVVDGVKANITLQNVDINIGTSEAAFELKDNAEVTLTLEGTNTLKSGDNKAGLQVSNGNTITIKGTGSLEATGGELGAGIGGGDSSSGGTITIKGGRISANGGEYGAGIGGGGGSEDSGGAISGGSGGTIVITGEPVVVAIGGYSGAGIGGGGGKFWGSAGGSSGNITLSGGKITASGGNYSPGIGGSSDVYKDNITISGEVEIEATGGRNFPGIGGSTGSQNYPGIGDSSSGEIKILGGTVIAKGGMFGAGIGGMGNGSSDKDIRISGGSVSAKGGAFGAGIGGGYKGSVGTISVTEGTVVAIGGDYGAGIGGSGNIAEGSSGGSGGNIILSGGIITATGGINAAGIGGGGIAGTGSMGGSGGNITLSGGRITATGGGIIGTKDNYYGAGIGGGGSFGTGSRGGSGGTITISNDPTVIATSVLRVDDIGNGENSTGTTTLKDSFNNELSYVRLMTIYDFQRISNVVVTVDGSNYITNNDGLTGFFIRRNNPQDIRISATNVNVDADAILAASADISRRETIELAKYRADLGGLILSSGTLNPAFTSNTTSYTASVGKNVSSMTITPTAEGIALITVNSTNVVSGNPSQNIDLAVGSNIITIVVAAEGGTKKTYTINIVRGTPSSGGNNSSNNSNNAGNSISTPSTNSSKTIDTQDSIQKVNPPKKQIRLTLGRLETQIDDEIYLLDTIPFIDGETNRTLVPLRFISQSLGAKVTWLPETEQVLITEGDTEVLLTIGSKEVLVNGVIILIETEPRIIPPGRTFVPLRFISEILGATVEYDGEIREISIVK